MATVYVAYQICTYSSTGRVVGINPLDNGATIFAFIAICYCKTLNTVLRDRRVRDRMVVGFISSYAISAYHH
jgi:hypothetical protein